MYKLPKNLHVQTLPNGLKVLYYYEPGKSTFHLEALINAGSTQEKKENRGIAHFVEHMIMSGTEKYPVPKELAKAVNNFGGTFNASTSYTVINVYGHFPVSDLKTGADFLHQYLFRPIFNKKTIEIQRKVIFDEILVYEDNKMEQFSKFAYKKRFKDQHKGEQFFSLGTQKSVAGISQNDLKKWYEKFFTTDNIILGGTGSIKPALFFKTIKDLFGKEKSTKSYKLEPFDKQHSPELTDQMVIVKEDKTFEKAYLAVSFPGFNLVDTKHEKFPAFRVLKNYLVNSESSRLFQELREKRGLVYSVSAAASFNINYGMWGLNTSFEIKYLGEVIEIIRNELKTLLLKKRFVKNELNSVQEYIKKTFMMRYDYHNNIMDWYLNEYLDQYLSGGVLPIVSPEEIHAMHKRLGVQELKAILPALFDFTKVNIILYGHFGKVSKEKIKKELSSLIIK